MSVASARVSTTPGALRLVAKLIVALDSTFKVGFSIYWVLGAPAAANRIRSFSRSITSKMTGIWTALIAEIHAQRGGKP